MTKIATLPIWKKGHTASEWLQELAAMAIEHPERWARAVVVFEEVNEEKLPIRTRQHSFQIPSNTDLLGTLETAKLDVYEFMKGRK